MKLDPEIVYNAWHKPSKQILFGISSNTTTLSLSDIPIHAKEIKAHVFIVSGFAYSSRFVSWCFSTLFDAAKIQCYAYNQQDALSFADEVITLQLDGRGIIDVSRYGGFPEQNFGLTFEILLYR